MKLQHLVTTWGAKARSTIKLTRAVAKAVVKPETDHQLWSVGAVLTGQLTSHGAGIAQEWDTRIAGVKTNLESVSNCKREGRFIKF